MIYIAADNDEQNSISEFADYSIKRITLGASEKSSNINVSVFCDGRYKRYTGGKSGANHFKLGENGMVNSKYLGETNSGSLDTFKRFFDDNFKRSAKNVLIFWGHSSGLPFLTRELNSRGLLMDDNTLEDKKSMTIDEIAEAVEYAKNKIGRKIDIVGLDVCSMMYVEVAYLLKDSAHYFASSQGKQDAFSWDYESFVKRLSESDESADSLVSWLVEDFKNFYDYEYFEIGIQNRGDRLSNDTFSVVDLNKIDDLKKSFNSLIDDIFNLSLFNRSETDIRKFIDILSVSKVGGCENAIDMISFFERLKNLMREFGIDSIDGKISDFLEEMNSFVAFNYSRRSYKSSRGISIRGYTVGDTAPTLSEYKDYGFEANNNWLALLRSFYEKDKRYYLENVILKIAE
tara:strand:+ start:1766 stop:2971 length:1206 start_codon:yes stop_codon:yes gene_type:complete